MSCCRKVNAASAAFLAAVPTRKPWALRVKKSTAAPGGEAVMLKIAALSNVDPQPIDGDEQQQRAGSHVGGD